VLLEQSGKNSCAKASALIEELKGWVERIRKKQSEDKNGK